MNDKKLLGRIGSKSNVTLASAILVVNAFIWYFVIFDFLKSIISQPTFTNNSLTIYGVNFLGILISAISSSMLLRRFKFRVTFLRYWILAGIFVSFTPLVMASASYTLLLLISSALGVYFGIGMPVCMGYYSASTEIENRGTLSGFVFLLIGVGFFAFSLIGGTDAVVTTLILSVWRFTGLATMLVLKPVENELNHSAEQSYKFILKDKSFLFYFVPWLLFLVVNNVVLSINEAALANGLAYSLGILENVLAGAFAVIFGYFSDKVGRKRLAITGFILMGLGYASLAIAPPGFFLSVEFYTLADGIAWGAFYTIFLLTIWGDLSNGRGIEKYYALGSLPYLFANFLQFLIGNTLGKGLTNYVAVFSYASFFLFLAVLPLIYAPETLPEKAMKDRDLKSYAEKALRQATKETDKKKGKKPDKAEEESEEDEDKEQPPGYDEARKLAEKYY